ncbi:MAG: AAA family ATPase [Alphaproteobacteria bacterium]
MHFKKLRVHGFKSFVDSVEMLIEPGITGVVGPNGCGKSNVVEALRWVMGEASAKRMRGGEMDDVIFGGSSGRAQRNNAEVIVTLDNSERNAPAAFNDAEELEISRRIDRGQGSTYKINGKDVRARDVQLLFADLATGANSTAIVSQGRIGALIGAKPTDRRTLLEEAAGIRGLHSRRHEAELRLRAAESNLERLEDVIGALDSQYSGLQRQARQANRYRKVAEQLRAQEAILLHLRWTAAQETLAKARKTLGEADELVAERTQAVAHATSQQTAAHEALPAQREAEAESAARLQAQVIAERQLQSEAERIAEQLDALEARLQQIGADGERERALSSDALEALARLDEEAGRIKARQADQKADASRLEAEKADAQKSVTEKEAALDEMTEHVAAVDAQRATLNRQMDEARQEQNTVAQRRAKVADEVERLNAAMAAEGDIDGAKEELAQAEAAQERINSDLEAAEQTRTELDEAARAAREALSSADQIAREALEAARTRARDAMSAAERQARDLIGQAERNGREKVGEAERALAALQAEESALRDLSQPEDDAGDPVVDEVGVDSGLETALGAALGDDLDASLNPEAGQTWSDLGAMTGAPALPGGCQPLSQFVRAPGALARRLSQIGLVPDTATAERLQRDLVTGQRLVTRDGGLWRWDGFRIKPGTATAAAKRLEQRNRLEALQGELRTAESTLEQAREAADAALAKARTDAERLTAAARESGEKAVAAAEAESAATLEGLKSARAQADEALTAANTNAADLRQRQQTAYRDAGGKRNALAALENRLAESRNRLAALADETQRLDERDAAARERIDGAEQALAVLEDANTLRERLSRLRATVAELRARLVEKRAAVEQLEREARLRQERLTSIEAERESWKTRASGAERRLAELEQRRTEAEATKQELTAKPAEIDAQRTALQGTISECEEERRAAAERLAQAEAAQREADQTLRSAEAALADARERRVRSDAAVEQAEQASTTIAERVAEKLECKPEEALAQTGLAPDTELPPADDVERRIERLSRERDNIGPVNLRAEQESQELEEQIASMQAEKEDLISAIARLRQGIGALNREGRERLLKAFEDVDTHFRELFVQLFGGGEAHLKLTESDDPLEAGLEIMAMPPGKKMQVLSLLSGGEQALTALALLFGVFLTNPAPICILDEVDAPLDDTNVDRFCQMLDQIAHGGTTRFLVVTHHRMTMARVDRLFGVTMAERGVSQLVSVDLRQAERMREAG